MKVVVFNYKCRHCQNKPGTCFPLLAGVGIDKVCTEFQYFCKKKDTKKFEMHFCAKKTFSLFSEVNFFYSISCYICIMYCFANFACPLQVNNQIMTLLNTVHIISNQNYMQILLKRNSFLYFISPLDMWSFCTWFSFL